MIDSGAYLWRCLRYIDLNMVRAGVVRSPSEWAWCGYQEIAGLRERYRVLDRAALVETLAMGRRWEDVSRQYVAMIQQATREERPRREACWTESIAVGDRTFIERIRSLIPNRMDVETVQENGVWLVREAPVAYCPFTTPKRGSKNAKQANLLV